MTTVQTANEPGISYTTDQSILTEHTSMQHLHAKFVPNNSGGGPDGDKELFE